MAEIQVIDRQEDPSLGAIRDFGQGLSDTLLMIQKIKLQAEQNKINAKNAQTEEAKLRFNTAAAVQDRVVKFKEKFPDASPEISKQFTDLVLQNAKNTMDPNSSAEGTLQGLSEIGDLLSKTGPSVDALEKQSKIKERGTRAEGQKQLQQMLFGGSLGGQPPLNVDPSSLPSEGSTVTNLPVSGGNRAAVIGGQQFTPEGFTMGAGGEITAVNFAGKSASEKAADAQSAKASELSTRGFGIVLDKAQVMGTAFNSMADVAGGMGRIAGVKNAFGGLTGTNPWVRPFEGMLVEMAVSLAKLAAPSARVGQAIMAQFMKTLPDKFSTKEEFLNQVRISLKNGLSTAVGSMPRDTREQQLAIIESKRVGEEQIDLLMGHLARGGKQSLEGVNTLAQTLNAADETGLLPVWTPDGRKAQVELPKRDPKDKNKTYLNPLFMLMWEGYSIRNMADEVDPRQNIAVPEVNATQGGF